MSVRADLAAARHEYHHVVETIVNYPPVVTIGGMFTIRNGKHDIVLTTPGPPFLTSPSL